MYEYQKQIILTNKIKNYFKNCIIDIEFTLNSIILYTINNIHKGIFKLMEISYKKDDDIDDINIINNYLEQIIYKLKVINELNKYKYKVLWSFSNNKNQYTSYFNVDNFKELYEKIVYDKDDIIIHKIKNITK